MPGWRTDAHGKRVYVESEARSWARVLNIALSLHGATGRATGGGMPQIDAWADELHDLADTMLKQLRAGIHENPPLVLYGFNPPVGEQVTSKRVYRLEYQHAGDKKNYAHDFAPGVTMYVTRGGASVILYRPDGKPLAKDFA